MRKKLPYTELFIIVMQLPLMIYGNLNSLNDLNQKLTELEIGLVALARQTKRSTTPKPSPQQKPSSYPKKRKRGAGSQPTQTTSTTPAQTEVPTQELGKQALEFTNQFRVQNKKLPLQWSQTLADLSTEHSQNMATGKVPFSHDGFQNRANRAGFRATAENVYMTSPRKDLAKNAVDAWINSDGHRKNLLEDYRFCGIGAYKNPKGHWYFTQMFGK